MPARGVTTAAARQARPRRTVYRDAVATHEGMPGGAQPGGSGPTAEPEESPDSALQRASARVVAVLSPLQRYWVGRVSLHSLEEVTRVEIFDRAMVLSAQVFTSVFPILILFAVIVSQADVIDIADAMSMPPATAAVLKNVLGSTTPSSFGLLGALLVLISGTSLSRALARMYQLVWRLPKPRTRPSHWWRWLAVIVALAVSLVAVRGLVRWSSGLTPAPLWNVVVVTASYGLLWLVVAYLLLLGRVPWRALAPGAFLAGFAIAVVGRVGSLFLPASLASSEERYGPIGVAFTYLGFLYVTSFALIAASVLGAVIVRDDGGLGRWLRHGWTAP